MEPDGWTCVLVVGIAAVRSSLVTENGDEFRKPPCGRRAVTETEAMR